MTITEKSFILVQEPTGTITIDLHLEACIRHEMRPILWFRSGLSCVVPVEVLQNALDHIDMFAKLMDNPQVIVDWKQCWPITDGRPAAVLAGLDY